jgi:ATP-dependent DNA helicase PIF1
MVFSSYSKFKRFGSSKKAGPSKTETFKKTLAKIEREKAEKAGHADGTYIGGVKLELSDETLIALNSMESTHSNIFLTGKAGTGKTTLIKYFKENTKKKVVILAPTGVSAVNIGGQTIHSFFKFGINISPMSIKKATGSGAIYKNLDAIIIDEISMVRADLLDCVDRFMRINGKNKNLPFGGVQVIAVGDLFQLPPVVTSYEEEMFSSYYKSPYFFDSKVFVDADFKLIELTKIYRQEDKKFIDILEGVRSGNLKDSHLDLLNKRHQNPMDENLDPSIYDDYIFLVTTNAMADSINNGKLNEIATSKIIFKGRKTGRFERNFPTNEDLALKENARIMMLNNDKEGRWVNGDLGAITKINEHKQEIYVRLENGTEALVPKYTWEMIKFSYDKDFDSVDTDVIGTFAQFPIRLAWAITIHKGQGKTYNNVIVDFGRGTFTHGQAYVALSRCRSLEGMILKTPLIRRHIMIDERINAFMKNMTSENRSIFMGDEGHLAI